MCGKYSLIKIVYTCTVNINIKISTMVINKLSMHKNKPPTKKTCTPLNGCCNNWSITHDYNELTGSRSM